MEELEALAGIFFLRRSACSPTALDHWAHAVLVKRLRILELLQLWQGSVCLEFFLLQGLVLLLEFDNLVNHSLLIDVIVICLYLRLRWSGRGYRLLLCGTFRGTCCLWLNRWSSRGRAGCCRSSRYCFFALCNTQLELILISAGYIRPRWHQLCHQLSSIEAWCCKISWRRSHLNQEFVATNCFSFIGTIKLMVEENLDFDFVVLADDSLTRAHQIPRRLSRLDLEHYRDVPLVNQLDIRLRPFTFLRSESNVRNWVHCDKFAPVFLLTWLLGWCCCHIFCFSIYNYNTTSAKSKRYNKLIHYNINQFLLIY